MGTGKSVNQKATCKMCKGTGQVLKNVEIVVTIPAGIESGKKIKLSGQGEPGKYGAPDGDLLIEVNVLSDPIYQREGLNLIMEHTITLKEALLGSKANIFTLDNDNVLLTIPAGIQPGNKLRIKGHGISKGKQKGDLFIKINVKIPKLTKKQKEILETVL